MQTLTILCLKATTLTFWYARKSDQDTLAIRGKRGLKYLPTTIHISFKSHHKKRDLVHEHRKSRVCRIPDEIGLVDVKVNFQDGKTVIVSSLWTCTLHCNLIKDDRRMPHCAPKDQYPRHLTAYAEVILAPQIQRQYPFGLAHISRIQTPWNNSRRLRYAAKISVYSSAVTQRHHYLAEKNYPRWRVPALEKRV